MDCTQCGHAFCFGCRKPILYGQSCKITQECYKMGLHGHHPRNCLYYMRDKEVHELQTLLTVRETVWKMNDARLFKCFYFSSCTTFRCNQAMRRQVQCFVRFWCRTRHQTVSLTKCVTTGPKADMDCVGKFINSYKFLYIKMGNNDFQMRDKNKVT